jgi:hypothetical protein
MFSFEAVNDALRLPSADSESSFFLGFRSPALYSEKGQDLQPPKHAESRARKVLSPFSLQAQRTVETP